MNKQRIVIVTCVVLFLFTPMTAMAGPEAILFSEDFEACIPPDFSVSNGVWDCCIHGSSAPPEGGNLHAGTVCDGNYPRYTDSRLISPEIDLTDVVPAVGEKIVMRFWHWFAYYDGGDFGVVQISVYDAVGQSWSAWSDISRHFTPSSSVWSPQTVDITAYGGKKVKIAFFHNDDGDGGERSGWHIDNVAIILKTPDLSWDFECGWDDWSADNGVWGVGMPEAGPGKAYSGWQCAGTVLDGTYPRYTDSRLVSPAFVLDCAETIRLNFWHWFAYYDGGDFGVVQISVYDDVGQSWSAWADISGDFTPSSSVWSPQTIDITAYGGEKVKIAFFHNDDGDGGERSGWYIDHVRINCGGEAVFPHFCECDLTQDGRCNILDYQQFIQKWGLIDCGTPPGSGLPPNDCACDLNKDGKCNILDYQRFITDWGNNDCQLCE